MDRLSRINSLDYNALMKPLEELHSCRICPRNCYADRFGKQRGYCKAGAGFSISSICIHKGEEPVISGEKGICNIFFTNCNLQCIYCQNFQISCNLNDYSEWDMDLKEVLIKVTEILDSGINIVGFVSPSHFVPQVKVIIEALKSLGYSPVFVYNTNGYDRPETIRGLEEYIDIYLPDIKYSDPVLSKKYSDAPDYPLVAMEALKEMYRQKGTALPIDSYGYAKSGIIIRHLILPGQIDNSMEVLRNIARELSVDLHISLMSQYYPTENVIGDKFLGRSIRMREYNKVADVMEELGFENGWLQEPDSQENYRPDFNQNKPFE